jgi:putative nucleotidyltransferase with HDIG domain
VEVEVVLDLLGLDAGALAGESLSAWLSARGCEHVRLRHLRLEDEAAPKDLRSSFRAATRELGGMFESAREGAAPSPDAVQRLARGLLDAALSAETPLSTLVALRDRDDRALVHSVNVACVVGAQARALGLPDAQVERLASAALTHDLGKVRVPEGVVQKQGGLTGQERALLARHTTEGARLLLAAGAELGAVVAFRHHRENAPDEPGLLAVELTKLADAFDGLRTLKPFSSAERRRGAVAWMARHLEARLNPYLLERFAKLLDVAPPGTYGWLTTGEVVKVVDVHRELALRPVVEVLDPRDGVLREGERVDLAVHAHQVGAPRFVPPVPERLARITVQDLDDLG